MKKPRLSKRVILSSHSLSILTYSGLDRVAATSGQSKTGNPWHLNRRSNPPVLQGSFRL